ncbi:MAG: hypothetical protein Q9M19_05635 [Mariprofundaceae bacterium]|nr:hypothetical protein [Mariprofundaceae bacterium]
MAGMIPFFLTGANAKIRVNNKTLAFCTNMSYSIKVSHINPKVLGMYEGHSIEPTGYEVTGSFSIIKYTAGMADIHGDQHGSKAPSGVKVSGNGLGTWGPSDTSGITGGLNGNGQAHQALSPGKLNNSVMFDIEVYQKGPHGEDNPVARLKNCRITQADFTLSKQSVATQTFQFMAVYADDDTIITSPSGIGQSLG